jgi:DNA-binding XRE family transcriptional regulator
MHHWVRWALPRGWLRASEGTKEELGHELAIDNWLRARMSARRMTQRMLGARSGVEHSTISRLLKGEREPSHETVVALYAVLEGECPTCHRRTAEEGSRPVSMGLESASWPAHPPVSLVRQTPQASETRSEWRAES